MDRCVNCGIATSRCNTLGRRALDDERTLLVIRHWRAPQPVNSSDYVCQACWDLAQQSSVDEVRQVGHRSVCLRCGRSLASRVSHLLNTGSTRELRIYNVIQEWIIPQTIEVTSCICHNCWVAADRAAIRMVSGPSTSSLGRKKKEDEPLSEKEIKVFCPKCKTEITHTAEGIQDDQTKILVAKVYHYFEQEYEELKTIYGDLDLTPLSKFLQRTALATGVSESTVLHILQEEEGRNAGKRQEPPEERRRARKRYRETNSSSEDDSSDDNAGNSEQSSNPQDAEMLVVKVESPESNNEEPEIYFPVSTVKAEVSEVNMEQAQNDPISLDVKTEPQADVVDKEQAQNDPISLDVKTEPQADVVDNTSETLALTEPAGTKRKGRIIPRKRDVTSARSSLIGDKEMEAEEIEEEEGIS